MSTRAALGGSTAGKTKLGLSRRFPGLERTRQGRRQSVARGRDREKPHRRRRTGTNQGPSQEIEVALRALGFALFVSVLTGMVLRFLPALQISRPDSTDTLKEGAR